MDKHDEAKVRVEHLTKYFGDLHVLDDVSFDIRKGEFLCVVGPTGCGKTTFLNLLTRIYMPSKGELYIDGEPADPKKHSISVVFQEPSSMPWLTVEKNISFSLRMQGKYFYLEDEVVRLWKEMGTTVVFITHNIEEAVYLAERVLILTNKPAKIKEEVKVDLPRPRDVTAPDFIRIRNYVTDQIKWW